jgi:hypothetical protein
MRDIVSPLAGFSSPFGRGADPYAILGYKPPLVLDYENSKFRVSGSTSTAPSVVTATRTGLATQLDASGNLVWNAHNLITYSEDFTNASWVNDQTTDSIASGIISPDGLESTTQLVEDIAVGFHTIRNVTNTITAPWTASIFIKQRNAGRYLQIRPFGIGSGVAWATFDPSDGSVFESGGSNLVTTASEDFGDGWYRVSITCSTNLVSGDGIQFCLSDGTSGESPSYTGDGTSGVYIWGAHLYRSDLGGMAPVPLTRRVAGSTTYVPTTSAAVYLPREEAYTYVSGSLVGPYYQKESDARTNLVTYSNEFDNVAWVSVGVTRDVVSGVSPDGGSSVYRLLPTGTGSHAIFRGGIGSSVQSTFSVYAKANGYTKIRLQNDNTNGVGVLFDLISGTATPDSGSYTIYSIEDAGNGFYRCSITTPTVTNLAAAAVYVVNSSGLNSFAADGTSSVLIYGAQLEAGSTPSSYIPTSGSTVTRSADSTTISAGNMPAYTNALSFQMEGLMTGESSTFANWTLDANNGIQITSGASDFTFTQEAAGVVDSVTGGSYTSGVNTPFNIASRHGSTFVNGAVDGTALTADTTPTALPDLSATTFDLAPTFNGFVKLFRVWADDIGDTGIAEAST